MELSKFLPVLSTGAISNTISFSVTQQNTEQPGIAAAKVLAGIKEQWRIYMAMETIYSYTEQD